MLEQISHQNRLSDIMAFQSHFLGSKSIESRKKLGQYFTGSLVSSYMASLISKPVSKAVRILDAGAGTGILAASTALHCLDIGCKSVHVVLYELDAESISNLDRTLKSVQHLFGLQQASLTYEIHNEDFVLARPDKNKKIQSFDISVINPPYFKYRVKESPYAKAVVDLYRGDPNVYASFMAIVLACLKDEGQMVTITPRSFTNGLYFKGFRTYLLSKSSLSLIHIFKRRDKVFKNSDSNVLQENIICHFIKRVELDAVKIRSSDCDNGIFNALEEIYPNNLIIDSSNDHSLIRIPESVNDANILKQAEKLETTFSDAGYFISTGPVVEHRTRHYITDLTDSKNSVPLYRPHNITPMIARWTGNHQKEASFKLDDGHDKHTIENKNYVLLKRFSSKDEKRRLVSGVHLANKYQCKLIGFGNKTNYIGVTNAKLSIIEAYGIAAIFNSSFMDKYFRCISGSTQVNATDIRVMKFPSREQVKEIGRLTKKLKSYNVDDIDYIVTSVLRVKEVIKE